MNYEDTRKMIKETYNNTRWYRPINILWGITHFGTLCKLAMVGIKVIVLYNVDIDDNDQKV